MNVVPKIQRYGLAVISCGIALLVAWLIDAPASCFLLAVMVSNLFGGLGPGLLSVALSAIAYEHFFLWRTAPPVHEPAAFFRFAAFLVATLLVTGLMETKRRAEHSRSRAQEALRQANSDLARVSRATTLGELTASLAHEVNQPIAAAVTDANTCLRWLTREAPDLEEAREAASRTIKDVTRAAEIINRVRQLFKKGPPERELVDVNEIIREMVVLLRSETTRYSITVRTDLVANLPHVIGDRLQLQQVLMNLIVNSVDAMRDTKGTRLLIIRSEQTDNGQLMVSVSDTGVGLPPEQVEQIFNPFFTTKPQGTGMGLRISRSIVESHDGRLWAATNSPRGATFHLTLPAKADGHE
jgi:C4-dicarboxylate-specific signal transduction histidine kinase